MQFLQVNFLTKYASAVRWVMQFVLLSMLAAAWPAQAAEQTVVATRVWPSPDYTRITLESKKPFNFTMLEIKHPDRIVLDLQDVVLDNNLKAVVSKILPNDPFIKNIRLGNFKPNVVRLVVDLKTQAKPKTISLKPAGNYQYRLVLDLYPIKDSLMTMLEAHEAETNKPAKPKSKPTVVAKKPKKDKKNAGKPTSHGKIKRKIVVAIDAGHGGEDPGASGATGTHEKDITLKIAKLLKALVDKEPNMRGELIRTGDYFIQLSGRVAKARNLRADIFISIHADAFTKESASGSSVFALSEKGSSKLAKFLAKKENESDLIGGVSLEGKDANLQKVLLDLSQTAMMNDSLKLAKAVLTQIGKVNKLHKKQVEQANFAVLRSPDIPSILVETAFLSNRAEEKRLKSRRYQRKFAKSIFMGIKQYFKTNPSLAQVAKSPR